MLPKLRRYIALLLIICTLTSLIACSTDQPEETTVAPTETEPEVTEPIQETVENFDIIKDGKLLYLPETYVDSPYVNNYPSPKWIHLPVSECKEVAKSKDKKEI